MLEYIEICLYLNILMGNVSSQEGNKKSGFKECISPGVNPWVDLHFLSH